MDNITHALVGVMAAEVALSSGPSRGSRRAQTLAFTASIAANNFPDLDFIYSWITEGKLGYLLHHRGHTHTLIAAVPSLFAIYGLILIFCSRRGWKLEKTERRKIFALAFVGVWLHILCDFFNSYGVHPYWPVVNHWYYGDSVFILEPWLWLPAAGLLAFGPYGAIARGIGFVLFFGAVSIVYFSKLVPPQGTLIVFGTAVALLMVLRKRKAVRWQAGISSGCFAAIVVLFFTVSARARSQVHDYMNSMFPAERTKDVVLSPMPSNPFCWNVIVSSVGADEAETVRKGIWAPYVSVLPAASCPVFRQKASTAAKERVLASSENPAVRWLGEHQEPAVEFRALASEDCRVRAFLRFARVPFTARTDSNELVVGDHRFDWDEREGFAELKLSSEIGDCPRFVPNWEMPKR